MDDTGALADCSERRAQYVPVVQWQNAMLATRVEAQGSTPCGNIADYTPLKVV